VSENADETVCTLVDFTDSAGSPEWEVVNDGVMGGVSASQFCILENGIAVFTGVVSLENGGGFASVRSQPIGRDLRGLDAFIVRVRGDGRRYKFTVRMETGPDTATYQTAFSTTAGVWEEHRMPVPDFIPTFRGRRLTGAPPLEVGRESSLGFLISDQQAGMFHLAIGSIKGVLHRG